MSQFFYLRKNPNTGNNTRFTIINTSVPYKSYQQGTQLYGYKYRPAIRMQFIPVMQNNDSTTNMRPFIFPSKIKIMKQSDYSDDVFGEYVQFSYCQRANNQLDWNVVSYNAQDILSNIVCNSNDSRKKTPMHGIAFHQYVAYSQLNIRFQYNNDNGQIYETISVYNDDATAILYKNQRVVTSNYLSNLIETEDNNDYVKIDLYYVYPQTLLTQNHIFATLYIKKDFYLKNGNIYSVENSENSLLENNANENVNFIASTKQFEIRLKFQNFIADVANDLKDLQITNCDTLNGTYYRTGQLKNGKSVYYNSNTGYYIYNINDSTQENYWIISNQIAIEDDLETVIEKSQIVYFYAKQLTGTWKYQTDQIYQYSSNINTIIQSDVPVVSYVEKIGANSLQINYQRTKSSNYICLFDNNGSTEHDENNLYFWIENSSGSYRWIYNQTSQKDAIFTRTTNGNLNLIDNSIKGTVYTRDDYLNAVPQFIVNRPTTDISFTIYFDYSKKISLETGTEKYLIDGIEKYFNEQIIISFQFNTWATSGSYLQHDISKHYQYAFGHVDDYYKSSKKSLYLLYQQDNINFKFNNKNIERLTDVSSTETYYTSAGFPRYINYNDKYYANITQDSDYVLSNSVKNYILQNRQSLRRIIKYRYSEVPFDKNDSDRLVKWNQINQPNKLDEYSQVTSIQNANTYIEFANNNNNTKQIFLQVADNQFNVSQIIQGTMTVYTKVPSSTFIKITGTNGGTNYTGIYIDDKTQQFVIDNKVMVQFSAYSQIGLSYKITGDIYKQYLQKNEDGTFDVRRLDQYIPFDANNNVLTLQLIPQYAYTTKKFNRKLEGCSLKGQVDTAGNLIETSIDHSKIQSYSPQGILNANNNKQITVTFRDEAGNVSQITGTIVFNTRLFETQKRNLRESTSTYDLQVYKSVNNVNTLISRTDTKKASSKRNWRDIFYPSSHGYPKLANGDIDVNQALKINSVTDDYDPVVINNGSIVYDEQGRTTTVWSNRKKYPTMVSSYGDVSNEYSGFVYWIIDNTGYGDITLQFEHFYLDSIAYGPPYNQNLGQRPDSLVIYDASQQGCVRQSINEVGQSTYTLIDTTKLKQLQVYTGSGPNVMSLITGTVNATAQGQFTTQAFATERLCLIFYSDYRNSTDSATSPIGSGFKVKAAKQIVQYWNNFDVDTVNGLLWIHTSSDNQAEIPSGLSVDNVKMTYDYYSTSLKIDYDQGSVIFDQQPQDKDGNPTDVYATYTYYTYDAKDRPPVRTFLLDADDLVDYADVNLYYLPNGTTPIKTGKTSPMYVDINQDKLGEYTAYQAGKLNNYYFIDKDRGIIQFNNGVSLTNDQYGLVPRGRIFADYRYHTYDRLGNDGYSDFQFNDSMLIAGITTQYPDYTWGDIKIVNQGDTQLRDGRLVFLARGQVQNNTITSVLDYDRPWDVQQGTAQQTYDKVAIVIRKNYAWNSYTCTRQQAKNLYKTSDVNIFPDAIKPKQVFYGRIVYLLGGANDSYPTTTAGRKTFSSEISGRFIQVD